MIKPTRLALSWLCLLLGAMTLLGTLKALQVIADGPSNALAWGVLVALLLLGGLDVGWLLRLPSPSASRQLPSHLTLGRPREVTLILQLAAGRAQTLRVVDHAPAGLSFRGLPQTIILKAGQVASLAYQVCALQRGRYTLSDCELQVHSPLGLWQQRRWLQTGSQTRVYPDFASPQGGKLTTTDDGSNPLAIRQHPRRGLGLEFKQLREFREGDSLRQIDWKATARHRMPMAREYQDERDQQMVLLLDCGHHMRSRDGELAHFDHALNACLLLGHTALRQGDAVGLTTFAGEQPCYLPARKGQTQLKALLSAVDDLHASQRSSDFAEAARQVLMRQPRRALVVLVTHLHDEDDEELLLAVKQLSRYHRVLIASLREGLLDTLRESPVHSVQDALSYCATVDYLNTRDALHERLAAHGVALIDARPEQLGARLVAQYLSWKKAGAL